MKSACAEGMDNVVVLVVRGGRVVRVGDGGAKESREEEAISACPVYGTWDWWPGTLMCFMQGRSTLG